MKSGSSSALEVVRRRQCPPLLKFNERCHLLFEDYQICELEPADRASCRESTSRARPSSPSSSCEAYARIVACAKSAAERRALAVEYGSKRRISAERVDPVEVASIVAEAAEARNGWKVIVARVRMRAGIRPVECT